MGGQVKVESELGKGTSFIINIKTKCKAESKISIDKDFFSDNRLIDSLDSGSLSNGDNNMRIPRNIEFISVN